MGAPSRRLDHRAPPPPLPGRCSSGRSRGPRVPLRSTRGYTPLPRWGKEERSAVMLRNRHRIRYTAYTGSARMQQGHKEPSGLLYSLTISKGVAASRKKTRHGVETTNEESRNAANENHPLPHGRGSDPLRCTAKSREKCGLTRIGSIGVTKRSPRSAPQVPGCFGRRGR